MSEKFDNKVNFVGAPVSHIPLPEGYRFQFLPDMTLRDYFAARVMQASWTIAIAGRDPQVSAEELCRTVAEGAYAMADEMLKARQA